jgi:hypothetical protein
MSITPCETIFQENIRFILFQIERPTSVEKSDSQPKLRSLTAWALKAAARSLASVRRRGTELSVVAMNLCIDDFSNLLAPATGESNRPDECFRAGMLPVQAGQ